MRRILCAVFLFAAVATLPGTARAQEDVEATAMGKYLLSLNGAWSYTDSKASKTESLVFFTSFSYFHQKKHEFGLLLDTTYSTTEAKVDSSGATSTSLILGPYYHYNFYPNPRMNFYVGPHLGLVHVDTTGVEAFNDVTYGLEGGMRYWLSRGIWLNVQPRYTRIPFKDSFGGNQDRFDILFGIAVQV